MCGGVPITVVKFIYGVTIVFNADAKTIVLVAMLDYIL